MSKRTVYLCNLCHCEMQAPLSTVSEKQGMWVLDLVAHDVSKHHICDTCIEAFRPHIDD